ncbi:MAG TPA: sensor histidine kinase, partial [Bacilli bacterium]
NTQILENVNKYFEEKNDIVTNIIQQIYFDPESYSYIFELLEPIDTQSYSYLQKKMKMDAFLYSNFTRDADISNIAVYSRKNDKTFLYSSTEWNIENEFFFKDTSWFAEFNDVLFGTKITPAYQPKVMNRQEKWVFTIGINLKTKDLSRNKGVLLINFDANAIKNAYEQYEKQVKGTILIFDREGQIIFDSSKEYYTKKHPYFNEIAKSRANVITNEESIINVLHTDNEFIIAGIIPKDEIFMPIQTIKNKIYWIGMICVAISILLNILSLTIFSKKIKVIVNALKQLPQGDILNTVKLKPSEDEIGQIAYRFNIMQERLAEYINRVYIAEISNKNAALIALQSQVNPHFLYNTLESIRMKAIMGGNEEVGEMIYILSALFRNVIKSDNIVKIKEELFYCELYLKLYSYRYEDKIKVIFDIDKQIMHYAIGKLLLQPILENSIIHGLDLVKDDNQITIRAMMKDNQIHISIEDNGMGMDMEQLNEINHKLNSSSLNNSKNIGLLNVNERIKIIFGERYGLEIISEKGRGTAVILKIPALTKEELDSHV